MAGELMAIESWMDFPVLVTVVIIKRSKVDAIVKARQDYRQNQKKREPVKVDIFKLGQLDLQDELDQVKTHKEKITQQPNDHDEKQVNLLRAVEQLTEKVA